MEQIRLILLVVMFMFFGALFGVLGVIDLHKTDIYDIGIIEGIISLVCWACAAGIMFSRRIG